MRLLLLVVLLTGCAGLPALPPQPGEYTIPVVKEDGSVQTFTVEPGPHDTDRMLFCIEGAADVLCVAEDGGKALQYRMPLLGARPEAGT